jgi:hypothetical protein
MKTVRDVIVGWFERRSWECPRCHGVFPYLKSEAYRPWVCKGRVGDHGDYRAVSVREERMQAEYLEKLRAEGEGSWKLRRVL